MSLLKSSALKAFAALAGIAALVGSSGASAQGVTIGQITPLTGASSVVGLDMQRGAELAAERINAGYQVPQTEGDPVSIGPGLLGGDLDIIIEDTESSPPEAMDAARKLVNTDQVPVVIGEYSSGRTLPTGQFTSENGVIQISTGANSPALRDVGDYFFSAIGLATAQGPVLVEMAQSELGAKTIATLFPNNPFGVGVETAVCEAAPDFGAECVATVRYEEQKTDYRPELRQITAPNPDAVIFFAYGADATLIFRQAYELGLNAAEKWIGTEVSNWEADVKEAPEIATGVRGIEHAVSGEFYDSEYSSAYEAKYGEPPLSAFGAFAYDAVMLTALAMNAAGSAEPDDIRPAIIEASKTYRALTGDMTMDEDGMRTSQDYGMFVFQDGALQPYTP